MPRPKLHQIHLNTTIPNALSIRFRHHLEKRERKIALNVAVAEAIALWLDLEEKEGSKK